MEVIAILLFISIFLVILYGYPVAFTLGGLSLVYTICFLDISVFSALPSRIMGVMNNYVLLAVPLFIFMGIMLEKSGLAERMLETMSLLLGRVRGGLAVSVILVGTLLAASTGIVGATVVTMGLISLPVMLKNGYKPELATGVIASSGTLGQIIPPSIVLVLLGSVLQVSVGELFNAALIPGLLLVVIYIALVIGISVFRPGFAPPLSGNSRQVVREKGFFKRFIGALLIPLSLILAVLGSIFFGLATPTEAAALGAFGAVLLTATQRKLNIRIIKEVSRETTHLTSMVFLILLGATTFSLVFREMQGDEFLLKAITGSSLSPQHFLWLVMLVVFVAGFFIDFIEIVFIIVPVVAPLFMAMGVDLIWLGILLAINLQTSFLTPPFGFSLFYLKGVAPPEVKTMHIYRGIIPFVCAQLFLLLLVYLFPEMLRIV